MGVGRDIVLDPPRDADTSDPFLSIAVEIRPHVFKQMIRHGLPVLHR
ncbi:hypothetical protein FHT71_001505 [Rhizobium sp. BK060]|nr:hypothetical protein [Rhizobium sp. BK060]